MNPPKISVLIPTYNYARFLAEAIESVLAQDFQDFELLVVDDCSADNTAGSSGHFARETRACILPSIPPIWEWSTTGINAWSRPAVNT